MIHHIEAQVLVLLLIASLVGMGARRLKLPYTLALVVAGLVLGFMHIEALHGLALSADLLLLLFLPPLLFEAALHLDLAEFRKDAGPILLLAVPGVLLAATITAGLSWAGLSLTGLSPEFDWRHALLFAAVIGATDPISVLALFKELGVPRRLYLLVEGESLLNDGVAVVVFVIVGTVIGVGQGEAPQGMAAIAAHSIQTFLWMAGAGLGIGLMVGAAASAAARQIDDHLIEITLTTLVAWGSFLLAEQVHASGVLATVSAGVMVGSVGKQYGMSASTRVAVEDFWEYMAFLANSFVFLLVGLELQPAVLGRNAAAIAVAFVATVGARAVVVYASGPLHNRLAETIPSSWRHVMVWGGLRGSLSMVLILTLPQDFAGRSTLVAIVFGVVAASLFLQGLTIGKLMNRLGLTGGDATERQAWERARGRGLAARHALHHLEEMSHERLLPVRTRAQLESFYESRLRAADAEAEKHVGKHHSDELLIEGLLRLLAAEREAIRESARKELLNPSVADELLIEQDARIESIRSLAHLPEEKQQMALAEILGDARPPSEDSKANSSDAH